MKLSIIVPVYKSENYLSKCIDSILAQSFTDFECILVDDGSPDNCPKICDDYQQKDPRIKVIHKENGGVASARNAALDISRGDFIGFVDSDDFIEPDMYKELLLVQEKTNAEIVACQFSYINRDYTVKGMTGTNTDSYEIIEDKDISKNYSQKTLKCGCMLWNKIYKKSLFDDLRFFNLNQGEDVCMLTFLYFNLNKAVILDRCLYNYYCAPNSIMTSPYSYKRVSDIDRTNIQIDFFDRGGFRSEADSALIEYVGWYIPNHISIYTSHKQCKSDFAPYVKQAKKRFLKIITNPKARMAKKRILIFTILFISPKIAKRLYTKLCPEDWWKM